MSNQRNRRRGLSGVRLAHPSRRLSLGTRMLHAPGRLVGVVAVPTLVESTDASVGRPGGRGATNEDAPCGPGRYRSPGGVRVSRGPTEPPPRDPTPDQPADAGKGETCWLGDRTRG
jgi:hypothetical protein